MPLKNLCSCRFLYTALNSVASDMPLKNLPCSCRFLHTALFSVIGENSVRNVPRSCRSVLQALFRLAGEMSMRNVPRSCRSVLQPCSESWSRRNAAPSTWASVTLPSPWQPWTKSSTKWVCFVGYLCTAVTYFLMQGEFVHETWMVCVCGGGGGGGRYKHVRRVWLQRVVVRSRTDGQLETEFGELCCCRSLPPSVQSLDICCRH